MHEIRGFAPWRLHKQDGRKVQLAAEMVRDADRDRGEIGDKPPVVPQDTQLEREAESVAGPTAAANLVQIPVRERPIPDQLFLTWIGRQGQRKAAADRNACLGPRMTHAETSSLAVPDFS